MRFLSSMLLLFLLFLITALPVYAAESQTPSGIPFSELETRIDALMDEHIGTAVPGAAVVVVYEGKIIFSRGYGWADIGDRIPVDPAKTVFEWGSINKTFVWVAVMQLAEQGLLDLDADVCIYLPDTFRFDKPFTLRDLLNHSAGFADLLLGLFVDEQTLTRFGTLEETLLDLQPPQIFTPGTVSAYSNWGSALAAFIVERVDGRDYTVFERESILIPANMRNTMNQPDWFGNSSFLANKTSGYISDGEGGFRDGGWAHVPLYPAGAINGTAEDLAAFIIALTPPMGEPGPLFTHADTLGTLFAPSSLDHTNYPGTRHGFLSYPGILPAFGHSGGTVAFRTDFVLVPETRFGYVLLTNAVGGMEPMLSVHELLLGSPQTAVPLAGDGLPDVGALAGWYISARRYHGNFLEFVSYAGLASSQMVRVSALDENKIRLSSGGLGSAVYVQTEPYVFDILDASDGPLFAARLPQLRFRVEEGVPRILLGDGGDFTALPKGRTMPFLIASLTIVLVSVVYFLVTPIGLLIMFFVRRKKIIVRTRFDYLSAGFLFSGAALVLNNLLLFMLFGMNPFRTATEVAPFIWMNYVLTGITVLFFAATVGFWRTSGEARGKRKALFIATAVFAAVFIVILFDWNFYVPV